MARAAGVGELESLGRPGAEIPEASWRAAAGRGWAQGSRQQLIGAMAELAVAVGANVQPGQDVDVTGEIGHLELLRGIVDAAYRRRARFVDVRILDPVAQLSRVSHGPEEAMGYVPRWESQRVRDLARQKGASIFVAGPTYPTLFDHLNPVQVAHAATGPAAQWRFAERHINWTIVPGATAGWAASLHPGLPAEQALAALWDELAFACRLDEGNPGQAWRARLAELRRRAEWLTALELDSVELKGPGTDLRVGLLAGVRWERPQMSTPEGISFLPNLPTEEVYTTPDPCRVDGHVRLTRPAVVGGVTVRDVRLCFRGGRVTDVLGSADTSALLEFIQRDEGAGRLGELALVDSESRVARLDRTFGEILLDENAASHIALGHGFTDLLPPGSGLRTNTSAHHLDVMFGSPEVQVSGIDRHGTRHPLLHAGRWCEHGRASLRRAS